MSSYADEPSYLRDITLASIEEIAALSHPAENPDTLASIEEIPDTPTPPEEIPDTPTPPEEIPDTPAPPEEIHDTPAPPAEIPATHAVAEATAKATEQKPAQEALSAYQTPLEKLNARLDDIFAKASYNEMWGVRLSNIAHVPTKVVLQKFLRANNGDPAAAEKQLTSALEWRKKVDPAALVNETFDKRFRDLGFVTAHKDESGKQTIITWSMYGAVKDDKAIFGHDDEFLKWRAAIMEMSLQMLKLDEVTEPIPEGGEDPYRMVQVHDYRNVRFYRMHSSLKSAKETIGIFSMAYPELLVQKYLVNVPSFMGWMFGAMKLFLSPSTIRKFHRMKSGRSLSIELDSIVSTLPKEYGGQGPSIKEGLKIPLAEESGAPAEDPVVEAPVDMVLASEADLVVEPTPVAEPTRSAPPTPVAEPTPSTRRILLPSPFQAAKEAEEATLEMATEMSFKKVTAKPVVGSIAMAIRPVEGSFRRIPLKLVAGPGGKLSLQPVEEVSEPEDETAPATHTKKKGDRSCCHV